MESNSAYYNHKQFKVNHKYLGLIFKLFDEHSVWNTNDDKC